MNKTVGFKKGRSLVKPTGALASFGRKFLTGELKIRNSRLPKAMLLGLVGVIFMYVGTAGLVSATSPWWLGKGDAPRHIDYVWSVYNDKIPTFQAGLTYPEFAKLGKGVYVGQPAAVNPPLFYAIQAPFMGPLMARGQWHKAIAVGRAINIIIGILCILALAWGGWLMGGRRKGLFAVAVPALGVMMNDFTTLNRNFAVDVLLVLFATLSLGITYKILQRGITRWNITALAAVSVLGMATKISYIVFLAVSLLGVLVSAWINRKDETAGLIKTERRAVLYAIAVVILVVVAIGWFYYLKDYKVSGSFLSARPPDNYHSPRPVKSLVDVFGTGALWSLLYSKFAAIESISVAMLSFALAGILITFDRLSLKKALGSRLNSWNLTLLALAFLGVFFTQVVHADGTGGYYFRYLLPVLLPMGLLLAYGLLEFKWLRGGLVWLFSVLLGACTIYKTTHLDATDFYVPGVKDVIVAIRGIGPALAKNDIPRSVGPCLLVLFVLGAAILALSLYNLSKTKNTAR